MAYQTIARLESENEALRKDAERYRFIRDSDELPVNPMRIDMTGSALDQAIDAAMTAQQGSQGIEP